MEMMILDFDIRLCMQIMIQKKLAKLSASFTFLIKGVIFFFVSLLTSHAILGVYFYKSKMKYFPYSKAQFTFAVSTD